VHWALGLFAGAMFAFSGLTGSTLVFYQTIDEWLNAERLTPKGSGAYRSFDEMANAARTALPDVPGPYGLFLPHSTGGAVIAWFKKPTDEPGHLEEVEVAIDPHLATVLSHDRVWGNTVVSFIYEIHKGLCLREVGEVIVGCFGLLLLLSVATGLYLWWPRPGRVRTALSFDPKGSRLRRFYDLHKLSGLVSSLVLSVLAFTGLYLEFPRIVISLVRTVSTVHDEPVLHSTDHLVDRPIAIDRAVMIAESIFPGSELKWIGLPQRTDDVYQVGIRQPMEVRLTSGESIVWLDQYSGAVLSVRDWHHLTNGERFLAWLFPLHNGEAFGLTGRWIIFLSGLTPLLLYSTALRMWWLKRKAHHDRQQAVSP
jgi:uncharacterized iron-regulated membrane protein